jgi:hypothetical protein
MLEIRGGRRGTEAGFSPNFSGFLLLIIRQYIATCNGDCRRGMDWMIGFIDTLYTPLGTTGSYSSAADLHTLQFTVTHTYTIILNLH